MHKSVFEAVEKIAAERGSYPFVTHPGCTEDVFWCNWAKEAGQELYIDASIRCGHLKMVAVCDQTIPKDDPIPEPAEALVA